MGQVRANNGHPTEAGASEGYEIRTDRAGFAGYALAFEPYLFNRPEHLGTQHRQNPASIGLWNRKGDRLTAILHLDRHGAEAISPPRAPLGGIQVAPDLPPADLNCFLESLEHWCVGQNLQRLTVKTAPTAYDEQQAALLQAAYLTNHFVIRQVHTNHHIRISSATFPERIHASERRRLRKCLRAGLCAGIWENPDPRQVYNFLWESRRRQGYPLSLDSDQIQLLLTHLPHQVQVFVVKDKNQIVSLTLAIRVNSRILYNFCPADNLDYRTFSPMVLLNGCLYEYAQSQGIELIDLGVSLDHLGHEKASLMRFKENLGAEKSEKVTYEKIFV